MDDANGERLDRGRFGFGRDGGRIAPGGGLARAHLVRWNNIDRVGSGVGESRDSAAASRWAAQEKTIEGG